MKASRTIHSFLLSQQEGQTLLTAQERPWSVLRVIPTTPADFDRTVAALKERGMVARPTPTAHSASSIWQAATTTENTRNGISPSPRTATSR